MTSDSLKKVVAYLCSDVGIPLDGCKGASVHVRVIATALSRLDADVTVFAFSQKENYRGTIDSLLIRPVGRKWPGRDLRLIFSNFRLYNACRTRFKRKTPDFIYERYGLYGWAGAKLKARFSIPLFVEVNTLLAETETARLHFPKLALWVEKMILNQADAIFCVSDILKSLIIKKGINGNKIFVVPNGVDLTKFDRHLNGNETRRYYGMNGKIVVGFVGSIKKFYGIYTLLESARQILNSSDTFHFMLVGEGNEMPNLKERLKQGNMQNRFTLTGGIPHADIPKHIAAMDIAVAPYSKAEPFHISAMKIFEYMAMAKPVIASAQGQIKDVVQHGINGFLIEPDDPDQLVNAILKLAHDHCERKNMGRNALSAIQDYTWDKNAEKVMAVYEALKGP